MRETADSVLFHTGFRAGPDAPGKRLGDDASVSTLAPPSYAVLWRSGNGPVFAGRLELSRLRLLLVGRSRAGERAAVEVPTEEIARIHIGRGREERIDGRPSLVLELEDAEPLMLTDAIGIGAVRELADRLGSTGSGHDSSP